MNKQSRFTPNVFSLAVLALAMVGAGSAIAAEAVATSTSVVVPTIEITAETQLSFGSFAPGTGGSVTLGTDGVRGTTGGVVGLNGATSAARFDVVGDGNSSYSINITATPLTSGGNSMAFAVATALTENGASTGTVSQGALTDGAQSIFVGGVLTVASNQAAGTYNGTITATVEYN